MSVTQSKRYVHTHKIGNKLVGAGLPEMKRCGSTKYAVA